MFLARFPVRFAAALALCWATLAPLAVRAQSNPIFVLNSLDASVSVIDPSSWKETRRIPTGKEPHHLYLTPDEKSLIIANALSDSLMFVDPKTAEVQRTVRGILDPYQLRFSPDMKWFVTAANRLNHVDIYHWDGTRRAWPNALPPARPRATSGLTAKAAPFIPPCKTAMSWWRLISPPRP